MGDLSGLRQLHQLAGFSLKFILIVAMRLRVRVRLRLRIRVLVLGVQLL
jgi:hypothetical protein